MISAHWVELTIPDKPNSRLQKYLLTEAGRTWLELLQLTLHSAQEAPFYWPLSGQVRG